MRRNYLPAVLSALVVIVLTLAYFGGIALAIRGDVSESVFGYVVIGAIAAFIVVGVGWALIARIRELKEGQEDDLGKY